MREALEKWNGLCKQAKKNGQKRYKINNKPLTNIFLRSLDRGTGKREVRRVNGGGGLRKR